MARSTKRKKRKAKKSDAAAWAELNRSFGRLARQSTERRHVVLSGHARPAPEGDFPTSTIRSLDDYWKKTDV